MYKLILMDIQMPVMNGIEASREIIKLMKDYMLKNNIEEEMTHIIALTSYTNKD